MGGVTDLAVIVPMLGRAHRIAPLLESIDATCDAYVLFVCSPGDDKVIDTINDLERPVLVVNGPNPGDYARKINQGIAATVEPLVFMAADDLAFHSGWLEAATARLTPGIGVVGTNDMCNVRTIRGDHSTHSLITRTYVEQHGTIDEPGKALHEGYWHEFCDDELVGTAKHRGAWAHADDSLVEHLHPMAGKAPMDPMYARQAERMRHSRRLYQRRRQLWT